MSSSQQSASFDNEFKCPISSRVPQGYGYSLKIGSSNLSPIKDCALPCKHDLLENNEKLFSILYFIIFFSPNSLYLF